jgi:hypothetical protein
VLHTKTDLYGSEVRVQVISDKLATAISAAQSASGTATASAGNDLDASSGDKNLLTAAVRREGNPGKRKRGDDAYVSFSNTLRRMSKPGCL